MGSRFNLNSPEDASPHRGFEVTHEVARALHTQVLTEDHHGGLFTVDKREVHVRLALVVNEHLLELGNVIHRALVCAHSQAQGQAGTIART